MESKAHRQTTLSSKNDGILGSEMIFKVRRANKKSGILFKDYCEMVALDRKS